EIVLLVDSRYRRDTRRRHYTAADHPRCSSHTSRRGIERERPLRRISTSSELLHQRRTAVRDLPPPGAAEWATLRRRVREEPADEVHDPTERISHRTEHALHTIDQPLNQRLTGTEHV